MIHCHTVAYFYFIQVFTDGEEDKLSSYIISCSKMFHCLTRGSCRRLAFAYAVANDKKIPPSWSKNKMAGSTWFSGFVRRNRQLALRLPEATSLARAISFNRHNVNLFFSNLEEVLSDLILNHKEFGTLMRPE